MANIIADQVNVTGNSSMTVEQKALMIRERARSMIANASLAQVQDRMPEYVPVVEQLMATLDVNKPLTLAQVGSWALQEQADVGLEMLSTVQQGPSQKALTEIDAFEANLRTRIKPLEDRLDAYSKRAAAQKSWIAGIKSFFQSLVLSKENRRTRQSQELMAEMQEFGESNQLLNTIVAQTVSDTTKVKTILAVNSELPKVIAEQVERAMDVQAEAAEKLYLTLVAVNEFQRTLSDVTIPELETRASAVNAIDKDIDELQRAKEALGLLETRRTDLMAAFLNTGLQRGMIGEMGRINTASATEMERLEKIALPQMLGMLGNLALQQRTGELLAGTKAANRILGDTVKATAKGFGTVLELSMEADEARLNAARSVVQATNETLEAVNKFREHEAGHIVRQRAVQGELAEAVGNLRVAAARIGNITDATPAPFNPAETDALALQITGVSSEKTSVTTGGAKSEIATPAVHQPARPASTPGNAIEDLFRSVRNKGKDL